MNQINQKRSYIYCPYCSEILATRIEENRERKYCKKCRWTYYPKPDIAVAAVVLKKFDNKIYALMVRRKRDPFKNTWMFPAGFLEFGEYPEQALTRELKEETGLKAIRLSIIEIAMATSDPRSPGHIVIFYKVETEGTINNNDIDENYEVQWKGIYNQIEIGFPHHELILHKIRSEQNI